MLLGARVYSHIWWRHSWADQRSAGWTPHGASGCRWCRHWLRPPLWAEPCSDKSPKRCWWLGRRTDSKEERGPAWLDDLFLHYPKFFFIFFLSFFLFLLLDNEDSPWRNLRRSGPAALCPDHHLLPERRKTKQRECFCREGWTQHRLSVMLQVAAEEEEEEEVRFFFFLLYSHRSLWSGSSPAWASSGGRGSPPRTGSTGCCKPECSKM